MSIAVFTYDSAVRLCISLTDGGIPYLVEQGSRAVLYGKRPDDSPLIHNCMIDDTGRIIYDFNEHTASQTGITRCHIRLYGADGELISAPRFIIVVEERLVTEYDLQIEGSPLDAIDKLFITEQERVVAEDERVVAEDGRVAAELERVENEEARKSAEVVRGENEEARKQAEIEREETIKNMHVQNGEAEGSVHQKLVEGKFPLNFTHPVTKETYSIEEKDVVGKYGAVFNGRSVARGVHSFAVNMKNVADGIHSFASGNYTVAKGSNSFTGGSETAADGFAAFATGNRTWAKGNHTFTSGNGTKALAQCSRAGGINTTASGDASVAEGHSTESSGLYSYSNGVGTKAKKRSQFSIGEYNADDANALFMVGNGSSDTDRSNAFSVQKDGSIKVGGKQFTPDMLGGGGIEGYEWSETFDDSCLMAYAHIYNSAWEISVEGLCIRRTNRYGSMSFNCHTACCEELPPVYPDWFKTSMGHIYLDASTGAFKSATAIFWNTASKTFETEAMSTDPHIVYLVKKK
jgi:hypothetical protein